MRPELDIDIRKDKEIVEKLKSSYKYAKKLYSSLCNVLWFKDGQRWSASWRMAGDIVASIRGNGENYLDYYCSGDEGHVDKEVEEDLKRLGWTWEHYPERDGSTGSAQKK